MSSSIQHCKTEGEGQVGPRWNDKVFILYIIVRNFFSNEKNELWQTSPELIIQTSRYMWKNCAEALDEACKYHCGDRQARTDWVKDKQ